MEPYLPPGPAPDDFTTARTHFEQILTRLSDSQMMACTEQALEEYVTTAGRDLQRQLIQDHLDARAVREARRVRFALSELRVDGHAARAYCLW